MLKSFSLSHRGEYTQDKFYAFNFSISTTSSGKNASFEDFE